MDPLSDVLSLLKPRGHVTAAFDAGGKWSIQFPQHVGIKFQAVISGQCWLSVEGVAEPLHLNAGDCTLLPKGRPFCISSNLGLPPIDAHTIFPAGRDGVVTYNGGGEFFSVGSLFVLTGNHADMLLKELPPIVHIRRESDQAVLRWALERMRYEQREQEPGGFLIAQHLAHMIMLQVLRLFLADGVRSGVGWLFALADKQMSTAITSIHDDPARRWTLQALAKRAGMSRSSFARKFKQKVGASPMDYLTRWRMLLAADRLTNSHDSISDIAPALGYESDSAFSTAFKRVMGCSPRQYSRGVIPGSPPPRAGDAASSPSA